MKGAFPASLGHGNKGKKKKKKLKKVVDILECFAYNITCVTVNARE